MKDPLSRMFPPDKSEWAEMLAHEEAGTWTTMRVLVTAWYLTLKGKPDMKTLLMTMSAVNVTVGVLLAIVLLGENVFAMIGFGGGLIAQGGYTLWYLIRRPGVVSLRVLIVGETLAVLIGGAGLISSIMDSVNSGDPLYGPMTVAGLIAAQAAATLMAVVRNEPITN